MAVTEIDARRSRPVTAAAIRFDDLESDRELSRQIKRHEKWQELAWGYYDEVGEVGFAVDMRAESLARCPLVVMARPEPDAPPMPADDPDSGVSPDLARAAQAKLRELKAPVGGQKQIVRQAQANTAVAGEWYLLNYDGPKENLQGWHVRSTEDITVSAGKIMSKGLGEFMPSQVSRVWCPHPRRFELANSGLRRVLNRCETVLLIDRQFRGSLRSRLFAGLLLLSNGFRGGMVPESAEGAGDGEAELDPVIADMLQAITTGIQDEGSASAVAPNTLWGAIEDVKDGARLLQFAQQIDTAVEALRTSELRRIAQGLDEPAAIVLGEADSNHWNLWFIGEQALEMAKPKAEFLADSFTQVFLHPELEALGADPDEIAKLEVALDLAPLARRPNADEDIRYAYEHGEANGAGLRRVLQIPESDAPDDAQTERWLLLNKGNVGSNLTTELLRRNVAPDLPDIAADDARPSVPASDAPVADGPPAIPASAAGVEGAPGDRFTRIDAALTERLFAASLSAFRRALEKAGNKARAKVAAAHRGAVANVEPAQIIATLGPTLVAAAGLSDDELLAGALEALRGDFDRWVTAAQADALETALEMSPEEPDEATLAEFEAEQAQDRDDAWEWFAAAALLLLRQHMASGQPIAEWEVRDLVRRSLARAGGADELAPFQPGVEPADGFGTGLAAGPLMLGLLAGLGVALSGWEWIHDSPDHPFPDHVALDGGLAREVADFGDEPGSHDGCLCELRPIFLIGDLP